ncbi:MAG: pyridoxamine 5'-phosphate oxidase family protein [Acidobacteria bacterium]|nr:pyridoxamine 5'-phosphate oxidase family protein [Acidobacteriota bacterium]
MSQREKIFEMLKGFDTVMLVTVTGDGRVESRPMQVADIDDRTGNLYFFTGRDSRKVDEVMENEQVAVVCQDERTQYLSISGVGLVVHDPTRARELWKEPYRVWFPDGPDDPTLRLFVVEPRLAEYWDQRGTNKLEYIFEAAKAYVSGDRPKIDEGDQHGRVPL